MQNVFRQNLQGTSFYLNTFILAGGALVFSKKHSLVVQLAQA